jgi:diguanylate cyclase (GGDEF)-like protein/PAS domain S-box-containing protein
MTDGRTGMPWPAWAVVAASVAAGAVTLALAGQRLWVTGWPGATATMFAVVFGLLLAASSAWPTTLSLGDRSGTFDLAEGFFVLLILLVPAPVTVVVFAGAVVVVQALRRQPVVWAFFTVGQVATSAAAAALLFVALHGAQAAPGYGKVGAALIGAACYLAVKTGFLAALLATLGAPWGESVPGGIKGELLVAGGSIALAVPTALLLAHQPDFLPLAVLPLVVLRQLGQWHFSARTHRGRLRGLFEATLEVNSSIGAEETRTALLSSAESLLYTQDVALTARRPESGVGMLVAPLHLAGGTLWLSASDRDRASFEEADRVLLDALASVGAIALANAELYAEVARQKDRASVITSSLGEGVCAISGDGIITFMNPAGVRMLGWPEGHAGEMNLPPGVATPRFLLDPALRAMELGQNVVNDDARLERADGTHLPVTMTVSPVADDARPSAAVVVFRDTSERKAFEDQLALQAFQDPLTRLANRRLLLDHLDHALLQAGRTGSRVAVLFGDIDRFKLVNDNLGHQVGDELLRVVAERLRRAVRPGDTLSRLGGDEFVIILEGVTMPDDASQVAARVLDALREPIMLSGGHEVVATMSIGMAVSEATGSTRDDLLHDADVAMYRAKERGRGGHVALFDQDQMSGRSAQPLELDAALHHALEREEIEVYFQPLISLADRSIVGAEALVRWDHPEHGILTPRQFVDLAGDNGTILPIGRAVLEQACRRAKAWRDEIGLTLEVGVNLSARQFRHEGLEDQVAEVLRVTGIDPTQLCLEITEGVAMEDVEQTTAILTTLHSLGIRLAIDDFGTGHSSLGYLPQFPIDVIKIDQSFVRGIERDPVKSAIVSAVVSLSQAIGLTTVVEGVETEPELEQIEKLGCHVAQGFLFARPLPAGAFEDLLRAGSNPPPAPLLPREVLAAK